MSSLAPTLRTRLDPWISPWSRGLALPVGAAWLLVAAWGVCLKLQRVLLQPIRLRVDRQLLLLVPELAYALAMGALCLGLAVVASRAGRAGLERASLVFAQALAMISAVLQSLAHGYYVASGQPLDYAMFAFSLARAGERIGLVASETHWDLAGGLIAVGLAIVLLPSWLWSRARRHRPVAAARGGARHHYSALLVLAALAVLGLALTGVSPSRRIERGFARDSVTTLVLGLVRSLAPDTRYRGQPSRLRKTGSASLQPRAGAKPRNIVIIILESTRADATTAYTPDLQTTPFLGRFAREGVLVERAYAVVPHTTKALVAILCGFEPEVTLSTIESQPGGLPGRCLPSLLGNRDYDTAFFQAPTGKFEDRRMLAENLGFATFMSGDEMPRAGFERINYFGYEDAIVLGPSERWLAARTSRPFLAVYLTSASHHPYAVPSSHRKQHFSANRLKNKYLNAIRYSDGVVERIVAQHRRSPGFEDTIFVVVGDHGEAFGEHGLYVHDDVVFEEGLRVPLLLRLPGAERAGTRIRGPVSELAIVPTLIRLAGFDAPRGDYEAGDIFQSSAQPVLFANCYRSDRCAAMIRDPYKLIHHFEEREPELYDLARDPGETDDLADDEPELVERWSREVVDFGSAVHATYRQANARALARFVSTTEPAIPRPLRARFGKYLTLLGLRMPTDESLGEFGVVGNRRFFMSYFYRVERPIPRGYALRLTLRGERGSHTITHKPLRGLLALEDFTPQRYIEDAHRVSLPDRWHSRNLTLCLSMVDERGLPVPVSREGEPEAACVPTASVAVTLP